MSAPSTPREARAQVGGLSRKNCRPNDAKLIKAKQNLATVVLRKYITETLAAAPPLTQAQKDSIIALLRNGGGAE